jgi:hypothetical protein
MTTTRRQPPRVRRHVADAEPARQLRLALLRQRDEGARFTTAWRAALNAACAGLTDQRERKAWRSAFWSTRLAWRAAYLRLPSKLDMFEVLQDEPGERRRSQLVA